MTHTYTPKRDFVLFGSKVRDFEKSDEVLDVLTDVMQALDQNIGAYIGGKFIALPLREGADGGNIDDLALVFVNQSDGFLDIVLRPPGGAAVDGGSFLPSVALKLTDEIFEGYRVVIGIADDGTEIRYEVVGGRYTAVVPLTLAASSSRGRRRRMAA